MTNTSHEPDADVGGKAHTPPGEPHPDLQKDERTDRDVGGPTSTDQEDEQPQEG